jgi:predicted MFS family arabinose efflux permease
LTTIELYVRLAGVTLRSASNNLLILAVGVFVVGTDLFVLNGLLPTIAADLRVTEATAGQLTTIFAATYAIGSPLIAAFTGHWDRRVLLGGGMAIFVVGMVGQAVGTTFLALAVARVVAAIGAAAFQANAFAVAGATAADETRGRALSMVSMGVSVSSVLGVPIGVFVAASVGWRGVMWGIAAVGALEGGRAGRWAADPPLSARPAGRAADPGGHGGRADGLVQLLRVPAGGGQGCRARSGDLVGARRVRRGLGRRQHDRRPVDRPGRAAPGPAGVDRWCG